KGPNWLFDLDYLTDSMNYQPVTAENKANKTAGLKEANHSAGTQDNIDAGNSETEAEPAQEYFVLPLWSSYTSTVKSSEAKNGGEKPNGDTSSKTNEEPVDQEDQAFLEELNVTHDTKVLEKGGKNEEPVNAAGNIGVSTAVLEVSTVNISTADRLEVSTANPMTPPTITSVFDNEDITLAETLVKMKD
ncbi:hypothetical protein Tco_0160773, partial [Tanacetum coccineum]